MAERPPRRVHEQGCYFGWGWARFIDEGRKQEHAECWTWVDQLYFATITFSTIGYGDVTPHTKGGRLMATVLVALGIFSFTSVIGAVQQMATDRKMGADKTLRQRLDELQAVIAQDNDGHVTPEEYIIFSLLRMQKVDNDTLLLLREQFKALDADGSNALDAEDVRLLQQACDELDAQQAALAAGPASSASTLRPSSRMRLGRGVQQKQVAPE